LLRQNIVANLPIQLDQLRVDHALSTNLSVSHTGLQPGDEVEVSVRERYNGIGYAPIVADPSGISPSSPPAECRNTNCRYR
jgi:hypothetical protein